MASQLDRLEALLADVEETIAAAFREFIRVINAEDVFARLAELIEAGDVAAAMAIVDSHVARFASVLPAVQQVVGTATAAQLAETASEYILAIGFDPSHPRAAALARANRLRLVQEFTAEQRRATRAALVQAFQDGTGTLGTARAFRNSIGLHSSQVGWVINYERRLRALDIKALAMDLRDRRFDRSVAAAIRQGKPLAEAKIARMVDRYRARALMYRSENIARTEALRATSMARHEALQQMVEMTGIDPRRVTRTWNATRDARVRDHHASMQGQMVGIDEYFEDGLGNRLIWPGDPGAPAETTINCRCTVTYQIKPQLQDLEAFGARRL